MDGLKEDKVKLLVQMVSGVQHLITEVHKDFPEDSLEDIKTSIVVTLLVNILVKYEVDPELIGLSLTEAVKFLKEELSILDIPKTEMH